jgi:hypothetical protein
MNSTKQEQEQAKKSNKQNEMIVFLVHKNVKLSIGIKTQISQMENL